MQKTLISTVLASVFLASCSGWTTEGQFVSACESVIKSRLLAPTTYSRVSVKVNHDKMDMPSVDSWLARSADSEVMKKALRRVAEESGAVRWSAILESDASNAAGVPIRSTNVCEYVQVGNDAKVSPFAIEVDGKAWGIPG